MRIHDLGIQIEKGSHIARVASKALEYRWRARSTLQDAHQYLGIPMEKENNTERCASKTLEYR